MKKFLSVLAAVFLLSASAITASAEEGSNLGALDTSTSSSASTNSGSDLGSAIAEANKNIAPSEEDIAKASETVQPVIKIVNYGIGIVLGLLGTALIAITVLDIVYIVSPSAVRNIGSNSQPVGGGMMGQAQPAQATGFAAIISDDCKAALAESGASAPVGGAAPMGGVGFGSGAMGFGSGAMGFGGGAMTPAAQPKAKNVIKLYMKKRIMTFVFIGVCLVVLTCTCFLDVGLKFGTWAVNLISGLAG